MTVTGAPPAVRRADASSRLGPLRPALPAPGTPDHPERRPGCGKLANAPVGDVRVPGAAAGWVLDLLSRTPAPVAVVHSGPDAVYLDVDGRCVGVLTRRAARVPCGVQTSLTVLPRVAPGSALLVGDRCIELSGSRVQVVGRLSTAVGRLPRDGVRRARDRATRLLARSEERLGHLPRELPAVALDRLASGRPDAVADLLGRGPGLTPLGDDVLTGWLSSAAATGHPARIRVADAVRGHAARTTLLSGTLLECAADGEALPELRDLLEALGDAQPDHVDRAWHVLRSVGGTSGSGLALGCLLALARAGAAGGAG